ncbi:MAG TPA: cysteine--tRNA ligase [Anaerolineae bacterium]|nr:cysteine--tRNA ligase [Anaerolineae bacterium]
MGLRVYNTLTHKKDPFKTIEPGKVLMYVCGPTVYDKAHVGHAMSALVFDVVRRYLEYRGFEVRHVMNYTDVDDKIIQRADALKRDPLELAEGYIREFDQHLKDLDILPATVTPRATSEMNNITSFVKKLIDKGYGYEVDGDVYFRVRKLKGYGKLSGRKLDDMWAGARVAVDDRKEDPMDFTLWKAAKTGEPSWDSPWGKGRPGWHIECSAMSMAHLGEQIDIHGGGNDLIFPHHENEIAQSEALTGKPFARFWMHNGMLQLSGEKMSKSIGNLVSIEYFLSQHCGDVLRMMVLNSGYRNPLTFNDEVIAQAEKALERLRSGLKPSLPDASGVSQNILDELDKQVEAAKSGFESAMDDDFNTAGALGHLFDLVRMINQARAGGATNAQITNAHEVLKKLIGVLGLRFKKDERFVSALKFKDELSDTYGSLVSFKIYSSPSDFKDMVDLLSSDIDNITADTDMGNFNDSLVELRNEARRKKEYETADYIRSRLEKFSVGLEDSTSGTTWHWE